MKKAIVIGATSGIGKALADLLVENGYFVGITGRRVNLLEEIKTTKPNSFFIKPFDIRETQNTSQYLNDLTRELGGLDVLIISSGTGDLNEKLDFEIETFCGCGVDPENLGRPGGAVKKPGRLKVNASIP